MVDLMDFIPILHLLVSQKPPILATGKKCKNGQQETKNFYTKCGTWLY